MANFENKKIDFSQINGGVKFENGDVVSAEAINAPIEASAYAQEVAEEAKRIAEESGGGGSVDLSNYVKKTDYATATTAGVVKGNKIFGFNVNSDGIPLADILADSEYASKSPSYFISKGTLENHKYTFVYEGVTTNTIDLSDDEKTSACEWLGAVRDIDIGDVILTKDKNKDTGFLYFGVNCYSGAIPQRDGQGKLRTNTPNDTDDETTVTNKKYVDETVPVIYTDADENNTTKKLRIYTDNFGYLHIDTE